MSVHSESIRRPGATSKGGSPEFETGKGCLMLSAFCVACAAVAVAAILLFGKAPV